MIRRPKLIMLLSASLNKANQKIQSFEEKNNKLKEEILSKNSTNDDLIHKISSLKEKANEWEEKEKIANDKNKTLQKTIEKLMQNNKELKETNSNQINELIKTSDFHKLISQDIAYVSNIQELFKSKSFLDWIYKNIDINSQIYQTLNDQEKKLFDSKKLNHQSNHAKNIFNSIYKTPKERLQKMIEVAQKGCEELKLKIKNDYKKENNTDFTDDLLEMTRNEINKITDTAALTNIENLMSDSLKDLLKQETYKRSIKILLLYQNIIKHLSELKDDQELNDHKIQEAYTKHKIKFEDSKNPLTYGDRFYKNTLQYWSNENNSVDQINEKINKKSLSYGLKDFILTDASIKVIENVFNIIKLTLYNKVKIEKFSEEIVKFQKSTKSKFAQDFPIIKKLYQLGYIDDLNDDYKKILNDLKNKDSITENDTSLDQIFSICQIYDHCNKKIQILETHLTKYEELRNSFENKFKIEDKNSKEDVITSFNEWLNEIIFKNTKDFGQNEKTKKEIENLPVIEKLNIFEKNIDSIQKTNEKPDTEIELNNIIDNNKQLPYAS